MGSDTLNKVGGLTTTFLDATRENLEKVLRVMPDVLLALGVVVFGWVIGDWAKRAILKIGNKLKMAHFYEKVGFTHLLKKANVKMNPADLIGQFVKGYIITIFLLGAANILEFHQISEFLDSVVSYIPNLLIALVILLLGMRIANTVSLILEGTLKVAHSHAARLLSLTAKYIIITFSIMAALFQLKIAADLMQILFTGFIAMIALAGGLAFGLGGKDVVREFLEDLKHASTTSRKKSRK